MREAFENQEVLKAKVTQVLAGGVCVSVDETRVFILRKPCIRYFMEKDLNKFKDQEIEFIITEFDPRKRRIIGNRKVLLVEQKAKQQGELLANLHVGDVIEGTVKNVTDFRCIHRSWRSRRITSYFRDVLGQSRGTLRRYSQSDRL